MNKFFPFITKKSSYIHIYDYLISRSKGVSTEITLSLFYIILNFGIDEIRNYAKSLPSKSTNDLYESVINKYHPERISFDLITIFTELAPLVIETHSTTWHEELDKFTPSEIMQFFLILSMLDKAKDITTTEFTKLLQYKNILNNLPAHVILSDTGDKIICKSVTELQNLILYKAVFEKEPKPAYNLQLILPKPPEEDNSDDLPF